MIYPNAIKSTGSIRHPTTPEEAKFSLCYCLATALISGKFGFNELDCKKTSKEVTSLINKIEMIPDETMENCKACTCGAKVIVKFSNGKTEEETILVPKGEASKPFTWDDIRIKMNACTEGLKVDVTKLIATVQVIEMGEPFMPWMAWIN